MNSLFVQKCVQTFQCSLLAVCMITYLCSYPDFYYQMLKPFFLRVFSSTENGEKAEKAEKAEPEPEVKEEEPEEIEEKTVKAKAKKDKKPAEEGFELWNELEIQRIKFMVSSSLLQSCFGTYVVKPPHGAIA